MEFRTMFRKSCVFSTVMLMLLAGAATYCENWYHQLQKNTAAKPAGKKITAVPKTYRCNQFTQAINKAAKAYRIEPAVISTVVKIESSCDPNAKGGRGEIGLMQIKPATAIGLGADPKKLSHPAYNVQIGTKYLRQQYDKFGSWEGAVLAYNRGPNEASKLIEDGFKPREHWHVQKFVRQFKIELSALR